MKMPREILAWEYGPSETPYWLRGKFRVPRDGLPGIFVSTPDGTRTAGRGDVIWTFADEPGRRVYVTPAEEFHHLAGGADERKIL